MEPSSDYKGGFETLEAWKAAKQFRIKIRKLALTFPEEESLCFEVKLLDHHDR